MMVEGTLSFPTCKVMFHVLGEGSELQDLQGDSEVRRRGRWHMRDEIFTETTAGEASLLDIEGFYICAYV